MDILIADSERDFLTAFKKLLSNEGYNVKTVFDGTQVLSKLSEKNYDLVILDEDLPRISFMELLKVLNENNIPVIVISDRKINSGVLKSKILANSYLSLPFLPDELLCLIKSIDSKLRSEESLSCEDVSFNIPSFRICGSIRVTNEEIDIFRSLLKEEEIDNKRSGPYINALNYKLEKLNKKPRISYVMNKGYRLVMNSYE